MKIYSKVFIIFFSSTLFFISCNPSSTANFLSETEYEGFKDNIILFGRILDKITNEPLVGANVTLIDYKLGAATDIYGNYLIKYIPPGTYNIEVRFIGYQDLSLSDIKLDSNKRYLIDFNLQPELIDVWD